MREGNFVGRLEVGSHNSDSTCIRVEHVDIVLQNRRRSKSHLVSDSESRYNYQMHNFSIQLIHIHLRGVCEKQLSWGRVDLDIVDGVERSAKEIIYQDCGVIWRQWIDESECWWCQWTSECHEYNFSVIQASSTINHLKWGGKTQLNFNEEWDVVSESNSDEKLHLRVFQQHSMAQILRDQPNLSQWQPDWFCSPHFAWDQNRRKTAHPLREHTLVLRERRKERKCL